VLVISNGPVPISKDSVIEGGGLRCWSLYRGLIENGIDCDLAVPNQWLSGATSHVFGYSSFSDLFNLALEYGAIIYNYASGDVALRLFRDLPPEIIRIADLYVPIHIEVLARNVSEDRLENEMLSYSHSSKIWEDTLRYADLYLITSTQQKHYYLGVLSALHCILPANYADVIFLETPQSVLNDYDKSKKFIPGTKRTILWWGAFYPWFNSSDLFEIAKSIRDQNLSIQLLIVGGQNPFNNSEVFLEEANRVDRALREIGTVEILSWVPFSERSEVFEKSDAVLILNKPGHENELSWRTRLLDAVEFETPVLTNGGDPFGEQIISIGGGFRVNPNPRDIINFISQPTIEMKLAEASQALKRMKQLHNTKNAVQALVKCLEEQDRENLLWDKIRKFRSAKSFFSQNESYLQKFKNLFRLLFVYYKKNGLRIFFKHFIKVTIHSLISKCIYFRKKYTQGSRFLTKKIKLSFSAKTSKAKGLVVILHQLDRSGAVLVGIELFTRLSPLYQGEIVLLTPSINDASLLSELRNRKINIKIIDPNVEIDTILKDKDVLVNSAAVPKYWLIQILTNYTQNKNYKLVLFLHENQPELFWDTRIATKVFHAAQRGMQIFTPSLGTSQKLRELYSLGIQSSVEKNKVSQAPLKVPENSTKEVRICMVGPTNDSRKRQLDILMAIALAQQNSTGTSFRKIFVSFVGITKDPIGEELIRLAEGLLTPGTYSFCGPVSHRQALRELGLCNVVVSLSQNESFGLYIAEAMSAGAVVLRTKISGFEETVEEGINGYAINSIQDLAARIEEIANLVSTPHEDFLAMMNRSQEIIYPYLDSSYDNIYDYFRNVK